jgi:S-adenosylmethionine decarboxylase proenzyme
MSSGKHLICDIKNIKNTSLLNSVDALKRLMDDICEKYNFTILDKRHHSFSPRGTTILYMLTESHFTIHTFPEHNYAAIDLYTCRIYDDNSIYNEIQTHLIKSFQSDMSSFTIVERSYI